MSGGSAARVVLTVVMCTTEDQDHSDDVTLGGVDSEFTRLPLVLVRGPVQLRRMLFTWWQVTCSSAIYCAHHIRKWGLNDADIHLSVCLSVCVCLSVPCSQLRMRLMVKQEAGCRDKMKCGSSAAAGTCCKMTIMAYFPSVYDSVHLADRKVQFSCKNLFPNLLFCNSCH